MAQRVLVSLFVLLCVSSLYGAEVENKEDTVPNDPHSVVRYTHEGSLILNGKTWSFKAFGKRNGKGYLKRNGVTINFTFSNGIATIKISGHTLKIALRGGRGGGKVTQTGKCRAGCPRIYRPICGSDGRTYANGCLLKYAACSQKKIINVVKNVGCSVRQGYWMVNGKRYRYVINGNANYGYLIGYGRRIRFVIKRGIAYVVYKRKMTKFLITGGSGNVYSPGNYGKRWNKMRGSLKQISVGDGKIVGVNKLDWIYFRTGITKSKPHGTGWKKLIGSLKYITVGDGKIIGVNHFDHIYARTGITATRPDGSGWKRIPGLLKQVTAMDNKIMGVNSANQIWFRTGVTSKVPYGTGWKRIQGSLSHISVGDGTIMGVNKYGVIYYRTGVTSKSPSGTGWKSISGSLKQIYVGSGMIIGVNKLDEIYYRTGVSKSNPYGSGWTRIPGSLKHISAGYGKIIGVNKIDVIYNRIGVKPATGWKWKRSNGQRVRSWMCGTGIVNDVNDVNGLGKWGIYVKTGNVAYAGTDSNVYIIVYGSKGNTGKLWLKGSKSKMERNKLDYYIVRGRSVGKILKIRVVKDKIGAAPGWFLDWIAVKMNGCKVTFSLKKWVWYKSSLQYDLTPKSKSGRCYDTYQLAVKTGNIGYAGTDSNIWVIIYGTKGNTGKLALTKSSTNKNPFERYKLDKFKATALDVGKISKIRVIKDKKGGAPAWFLTGIDIKSKYGNVKFCYKKWVWKRKKLSFYLRPVSKC